MYLYGIAGILFLALTVVAGWAVTGRLKTGLTPLEALAASAIVGIVGAGWIGFAGYLATGLVEAGAALAALIMIAAILFLRPWRNGLPRDRTHLPALAIIFVVSFLLMFVCLLNYYDGEYHVAYPVYGDAALHSTITSSFSQGLNYPPTYPFMAGVEFRYTLLIDFYSAMLDRLGLGLQWSLVLPGVLLLASLLSLLYFLGARFTGRRLGGAVSVALIMLSGGLGFAFAIGDWLASHVPIVDFLTNHYLNYTTLYDYDLVMTNFMSVVLNERTALTGLAVGALVTLLFYIVVVEKRGPGRADRTPLLFAGVLAGLLPTYQVYSYIGIMLAAALLLVAAAAERRKDILKEKEWLYFFAPAILLAVPQAFWLTGNIGGSYIRVHLGWMADSIADVPWFWIKNLGAELLLLIVGALVVGRRKLLFYLPFTAVFVLGNVLLFQPWDYDNHNFFTFWLVTSVPVMAAALVWAWDRRRYGKPLFVVLLVLAVLTGAMVGVFLVRQYTIFSRDSVHVADWIEQHTPRDAVFLTGDVHNHPVTCLAGRKTYLGYLGWIETHGVSTDERFREVKAMWSASSAEDLYRMMAQHGIGYVYLGPEELDSQTYAVNRNLFDSLTPVFDWTGSSGHRYRVFQAP